MERIRIRKTAYARGTTKVASASHISRVYLKAVLQRAGGNQSEASRIAGIDCSYFGKLLHKFDAH